MHTLCEDAKLVGGENAGAENALAGVDGGRSGGRRFVGLRGIVSEDEVGEEKVELANRNAYMIWIYAERRRFANRAFFESFAVGRLKRDALN